MNQQTVPPKPKKRRRVLFRLMALTLGLACALMIAALLDRTVIANVLASSKLSRWKPHTFVFKSDEFDLTVTTNNMGMHDVDRDFQKPKTAFRILTLGDSFTFGWAMPLKECWPKLIEDALTGQGRTVEVVNAGQGGTSTEEQAQAAEALIPIVRPDLVIVAVLQGDDLAQIKESQSWRKRNQPPPEPWIKKVCKGFAIMLCPHAVQLWRSRYDRPSTNRTGNDWREEFNERLQQWDASTKDRYRSRVSDEARRRAESGLILPGIVTLAVAHPDHFLITMDLDAAETKDAIAGMSEALTRIREVAAAQGAAVLVVSVPYGAYVHRRDWDTRQQLGFDLTEECLTSQASEEAIERAARQAKVPTFLTLTEFRRHAQDQELYFRWDGHFNAEGHKLFAELLRERLRDTIANK